MTQTIIGPMRGVILARPATLEVRKIGNSWHVVWVQPIKEDVGWDELVAGSSNKTPYVTKEVAETALAALKATNPTPPG